MSWNYSRPVQKLTANKKDYKQLFIIPVAEGLYYSSRNPTIPFSQLGKEEQSFWYRYARDVPAKYRTANLSIFPYDDFCRTCLITDDEILAFAKTDHENRAFNRSLKSINREFFTWLNYLIPVILKKSGYEIIRDEEVSEINGSMVKKLARAIHSRYLHEIKSQQGLSEETLISSDFDDLPEDIKYSNIDNAAQIPAKLLSIGYKIRPINKGFQSIALHLREEEVETMARVEHVRWCWEKRLSGWTYGIEKDDLLKMHPSLKPYEELSENERNKDRELVKLIPSFLKDIDYEAFPISPNRIRRLAYAIKPQSSIHKILVETRELNDQIRKVATLTPEIEIMVDMRNKKIEEAIREVEGSYNYAQHIQETFLPDDLFVRESFPDSFILYKPKDIVSGDFYFFSKQGHIIIFAVADCTGHGIPGALLSTIGYGMLDQAVNEVKLTDPALILHHLYSKIHRFLRYDSEGSGIPDDMDIILCSLDTNNNILNYCGIRNPLLRMTDGELIEYPVQTMSEINCSEGDCHFQSKSIKLKLSDTLYLFSDGYTDQFGGPNHKKYKADRFKNFLQNIQTCSMSEQSDRLYEEIERWREEKNEEQTDDILILGIRI